MIEDWRESRIGRPLPLAGEQPAERADAAENRRRLLVAARQVIEREGIDSLTMDHLAETCGVGVGTVYRRFQNLAGLYFALLDDDERKFQTAFLYGEPPLGPGAPPAERIQAFLEAQIERHRSIAPIMARAESRLTGSRSPPYIARRTHLIGLIEQADASLDAAWLADALQAAVSASLYLFHTQAHGFDPQRVKDGIASMVRRLFPDG